MSITPLEFAYKLIFTGDIAVTGRFVRQFCLHFVYTNTSEMQRYFLMAFSWYIFLRAHSLIKNYALSFLIKLIHETNGLANRFWHKKWRRISNVRYHVFYLCLGIMLRSWSVSFLLLFFSLSLESFLLLDPSCFFPIRSVSFSISNQLILSCSLPISLIRSCSLPLPFPPVPHSFFCFLVCIQLHFVWVFLFYSNRIKKKFIRITHSRRFHGLLMIFHGREQKKSVWFCCVNSKLSKFFFNCSSAMTTMELHT